MFNLFKSKTSDEKTSYPAIVDEVHNEFYIAGDRLLCEAKTILKDLENKELSKGKRLAAMGFTNTREASIVAETEKKLIESKKIAQTIFYYKTYYPNNKFIIEKQVQEICQKYNLVFGDISAYKGFVPESKLSLIEKFKINKADIVKEIWSIGITMHYTGQRLNDGGKSAKEWSNLYKAETVISKFKICAPQSEMEIKSHQQLVGYKIQDVPDPVVLQPVKGGYLIVCAWGNEASDGIVVNEINN